MTLPGGPSGESDYYNKVEMDDLGGKSMSSCEDINISSIYEEQGEFQMSMSDITAALAGGSDLASRSKNNLTSISKTQKHAFRPMTIPTRPRKFASSTNSSNNTGSIEATNNKSNENVSALSNTFITKNQGNEITKSSSRDIVEKRANATATAHQLSESSPLLPSSTFGKNPIESLTHDKSMNTQNLKEKIEFQNNTVATPQSNEKNSNNSLLAEDKAESSSMNSDAFLDKTVQNASQGHRTRQSRGYGPQRKFNGPRESRYVPPAPSTPMETPPVIDSSEDFDFSAVYADKSEVLMTRYDDAVKERRPKRERPPLPSFSLFMNPSNIFTSRSKEDKKSVSVQRTAREELIPAEPTNTATSTASSGSSASASSPQAKYFSFPHFTFPRLPRIPFGFRRDVPEDTVGREGSGRGRFRPDAQDGSDELPIAADDAAMMEAWRKRNPNRPPDPTGGHSAVESSRGGIYQSNIPSNVSGTTTEAKQRRAPRARRDNNGAPRRTNFWRWIGTFGSGRRTK